MSFCTLSATVSDPRLVMQRWVDLLITFFILGTALFVPFKTQNVFFQGKRKPIVFPCHRNPYMAQVWRWYGIKPMGMLWMIHGFGMGHCFPYQTHTWNCLHSIVTLLSCTVGVPHIWEKSMDTPCHLVLQWHGSAPYQHHVISGPSLWECFMFGSAPSVPISWYENAMWIW